MIYVPKDPPGKRDLLVPICKAILVGSVLYLLLAMMLTL